MSKNLIKKVHQSFNFIGDNNIEENLESYKSYMKYTTREMAFSKFCVKKIPFKDILNFIKDIRRFCELTNNTKDKFFKKDIVYKDIDVSTAKNLIIGLKNGIEKPGFFFNHRLRKAKRAISDKVTINKRILETLYDCDLALEYSNLVELKENTKNSWDLLMSGNTLIDKAISDKKSFKQLYSYTDQMEYLLNWYEREKKSFLYKIENAGFQRLNINKTEGQPIYIDEINQIFDFIPILKELIAIGKVGVEYRKIDKKCINYLEKIENIIRKNSSLSNEIKNAIEKEDVEAYIVHLFEDRKLKKTSVNTILSALKSLYKELESNGLKNPVKYIKLFKVNRNIENVLKVSIDDIRKIIGLYKIDSEKKYRNITILYTLFYTGMRSKELLTLQFKHFLRREDEYFFKLVQTKSGKDVYKPIHKSLVKKLEEYRSYLMNMYSLDSKDLDEHYIFATSVSNNTPLSYRSLNVIIQDMGKLIEKDISPHNIRHAIATELSLNGADILEIRDFLGHSDTKVTEVYINARSVLEKKVLEKLPEINLDEG